LTPPPEVEEDPDVADFAGPSQGWPPKPLDVTRVVQLPVGGNPTGIDEELKSKIRQVALNDNRVKEALGGRFAYVSVCKLGGKVARQSPEPITRVTFYSYAKNQPVQVEMVGSKITGVNIRKGVRGRDAGYSPIHGKDEKEKAIDIAKNDGSLKDKVGSLTARVIRNAPGSDRQFQGHRVMFVSFMKDDETIPLYTALVDLTENKVLSVKGPLVTRLPRRRDES
jgi:hypothetical protein